MGILGDLLKDVGDYVKENPVRAVALFAAAGVLGAALLAPAAVAAPAIAPIALGGGLAPISLAPAAVGAGSVLAPSAAAAVGAGSVLAPSAASALAPSAVSAAIPPPPTDPGIFSGAKDFFVGTPSRALLTSVGVQAAGGVLSSLAASRAAREQAEVDREFEREMFEKRALAQRVTPVASPITSFAPRMAAASPQRMTAAQALRLRRQGSL